MNTKNLLLSFLDELIIEVESLSDIDIKKLESGEYKFSLKLVKKQSSNKTDTELTDSIIDDVLLELKKCADRESGYEILNKNFKNKKELEAFAKASDVFILKQDKVDTIKDKIIEGIIGASLRSLAIQGDNT